MSDNDRWERLTALLAGTQCACEHKGYLHIDGFNACSMCVCPKFEPVLLTGGAAPAGDPPPGSSYRVPVSPEHRQLLTLLADAIKRACPPGWGFGLFMFTFGEGGTMTWISNAQRSDVVKALQEWMRTEGS